MQHPAKLWPGVLTRSDVGAGAGPRASPLCPTSDTGTVMAEATTGLELGHVAALLAAAVVAVPLFRRLKLGSVLGYLAAGLAIGPFGFGLFREPEPLLHVAAAGLG